MKFKNTLKRNNASHKGDYGRILIVAGSRGMSGAASLAGMAALRSGAGLVTMAVPDSIYPLVARRDPELMVQPFRSTSSGALDLRAFPAITKILASQDVLAIGPGLSRNVFTAKLIHKLILSSKIPIVVDADALNAFAGRPEILLQAQTPLFLTPHEGEFERLFKIAVPRHSSIAQRRNLAQAMAEKFGVYVILKGHRTVVAAPDGKIFVNKTGNPGMATAGCGDVLTGILAGLLGRGKNHFETVCLAVTAHGLAGDLAAKKKGQASLIAGDILEFLPAAFKKLSRP